MLGIINRGAHVAGAVMAIKASPLVTDSILAFRPYQTPIEVLLTPTLFALSAQNRFSFFSLRTVAEYSLTHLAPRGQSIRAQTMVITTDQSQYLAASNRVTAVNFSIGRTTVGHHFSLV